MKCLNIIVYYNNSEEIENYILEVAAISHNMVDIMLIVNSDINNQIVEIENRLKTKGVECLQIMDYGENVGYLNSMLKTIKSIDLNHYDYVILSNTDIHYESKDFFSKLSELNVSEEIGCIAPSVFAEKSNSYSNPHYLNRVPKKKLKRLVRIFKLPFLGKIYLKLSEKKAENTRNEKKSSCFVYSPHGCYMIFTMFL